MMRWEEYPRMGFLDSVYMGIKRAIMASGG